MTTGISTGRALAFGLTMLAGSLCGCSTFSSSTSVLPSKGQVDVEVHRMMDETGARGLALAIVDNGEVSYVAAYGDRNAAGDGLEVDSIMYGASLTKTAFAYMVLQLVDEGIVDLDQPIPHYLKRPLPAYTEPEIEDLYARWSDLAGDDRWKSLTPRMLLNHASGFANFGFLEPDGKLRFHFDPGTRYSYSGDGIILLQFVLEKGLGLDVGSEMQRRVFEPLAMTDSSLIWRDDFSGRAADGWEADGKPVPHDDRSSVRAAGSMDSTIADVSRLAAAIVRGDLISPSARMALSDAQLPIASASQFPTLQADAKPEMQVKGLAAGLGVVVFDGPQGRGFFKGGHNDSTGNMLACLEARKRCVVILGNDARAERAIPYLTDYILGSTGIPWSWEYGDMTFWRPETRVRKR